jgi:hypothetical protein
MGQRATVPLARGWSFPDPAGRRSGLLRLRPPRVVRYELTVTVSQIRPNQDLDSSDSAHRHLIFCEPAEHRDRPTSALFSHPCRSSP